MKLSLQTKIVLPSVLVFVLAFGFSGWNSYSRAEKALREAVVAMLEGNLRSVSMGLRDYKQGILDDLRGNTTITPMRMLYSADRREAGKESVRVSLRNRPLLRDGVFLYVDATDENGRVLASSDEKRVGMSVADSPAFKTALDGRDAVGAALPGPGQECPCPLCRAGDSGRKDARRADGHGGFLQTGGKIRCADSHRQAGLRLCRHRRGRGDVSPGRRGNHGSRGFHLADSQDGEVAQRHI